MPFPLQVAPSVRTVVLQSRWLLIAALPFALARCAAEPRNDDSIRVGYLFEAGSGIGGRQGAELGAEEAAHAGELVGRELRLVTVEAASPGEVAGAAQELIDAGVVALIGGFSDASCRALSDIAETAEVIFLNVGCRSDALRSDL